MGKKKIAMIGAGSLVFGKMLLSDIMATSALAGSEIALLDVDESKLRSMEVFARRMLADNDSSFQISATLDRKEALKDADFVVVMIQVGGMRAFDVDYNVPLKYGVDQCIGDTLAPGGIFRGLRTIPLLLAIAADMEKYCKPQAIMLQYANPMAINCLALGKASRISFVGLCHGVQTTLTQIAHYCQVPNKDEIRYTCGGINHMDWFLTLEHNGRDLYPRLRQLFEKPEYYKSEKVRGEVFRHFGYFMTETTGHLSEYLPWFRKNKEALELYCDEPGFGGETGAYYKWSQMVTRKYADHDPLEFETTKLDERSVEYCACIMEAVVTDKPFRFMGNVRNDGFISNLPKGCCVEVPTFADAMGLHPSVIGQLPPQCAAACMTNVNVQTLAAEATLNREPEHVVHALALDPLTAAVCTLKEIRDMSIEMLEAEREWLPQFTGKQIQPRRTISIPKGCKEVDIPMDPAQAIMKRFIKLAEQKIE